MHAPRAAAFGLLALAVLAGPAAAQNVDWPLHNLDLAGSRYAETDQITPENAHLLTPRWLFQHGVIDGVSNQTTPVIVDGVMYVTDSRGSVYAVDGANGHLLWIYDVTELLGGGRREGYIFRHRGVTYADGVVYSAAGSFMFALDAETGEPVEGFGENGQASVILDVLRQRYPDVETAISMGYWFTSAPQIHDGILYVGSTRSESMIPGGHVLAVDAETGEVVWHFNTVPQDENDQGWDIAGPTWVGGGTQRRRHLGDAVHRPRARPPLRGGREPVRRQHPAGRREPVHRLDHRAGPEDRAARLVLPAGAPRRLGLRQRPAAGPLRHGRRRRAGQGPRAGQQEQLALHPEPRDRRARPPHHRDPGADRDRPRGRGALPDPADSPQGERRADGAGVAGVPHRHPPRARRGQALPRAVHPDSPGDQRRHLRPRHGGRGELRAHRLQPRHRPPLRQRHRPAVQRGRGPKGYFSAYDPTTGELVWRQIFEGYGQAGSVVTKGGVVFVGTGSNIAGYFFAYDARTGEELWRYNTGAGIFASPAVYMVDGEEFVTVASGGGSRGRRGGDLILSFALPKQ